MDVEAPAEVGKLGREDSCKARVPVDLEAMPDLCELREDDSLAGPEPLEVDVPCKSRSITHQWRPIRFRVLISMCA